MFKTLFGPKEPKATFVRSMEEMRLKTHANTAWGLGSTDRWDADLELGTIKFSNADGYTVTAPVQVIGTYDSTWSEWLWGWDHPSVGQALAQDARLAREFGRRHKLEQFTAPGGSPPSRCTSQALPGPIEAPQARPSYS